MLKSVVIISFEQIRDCLLKTVFARPRMCVTLDMTKRVTVRMQTLRGNQHAAFWLSDISSDSPNWVY